MKIIPAVRTIYITKFQPAQETQQEACHKAGSWSPGSSLMKSFSRRQKILLMGMAGSVWLALWKQVLWAALLWERLLATPPDWMQPGEGEASSDHKSPREQSKTVMVTLLHGATGHSSDCTSQLNSLSIIQGFQPSDCTSQLNSLSIILGPQSPLTINSSLPSGTSKA